MGDVKTIAVLGANGRIGREVMKAFLAAGWQVTAITRNAQLSKKVPGKWDEQLKVVGVNALDAATVIDATKGHDFIFNGLNPVYTDWHSQALIMAKNVIDAVEANQAIHLFPGNVYNYGTKIPDVISEMTAFHADTKKGEIRIQMEEMFADAAKSRGIKTLTLRAGDFFGGEGTGSWFDLSIAAKADKGKMTYPGPMDINHAWAYLPDFARAFVCLASHAGSLATFESINFEGHSRTGKELKQAIEKATDRTMTVSGIPWWFLRIIGLAAPMMREISEVAYLWQTPHQLKQTKGQEIFKGFVKTPFETAISQAIAEIFKQKQYTQKRTAVPEHNDKLKPQV